jgi:mycofactocin precursor
MEEREDEIRESRDESKDEDIFETEEVRIEEMAIDGICGVY